MVNKLVSGLVIVLLVIVAGWFAFSQRHRIFDAWQSKESPEDIRPAPAATAKKKNVPQGINKPRTQKVIKPALRNTPASGKTVAQNMPASSRTLKSRPAAPPGKSQTRARTIKKPRPANRKIPLKNRTKRPQPNQPSGSRRTPAPAKAKQPPTSKPSPQKAVGRQTAGLDALNTINDSKLKLQAIAWSDDTTRRMAVINNQIVREGGAVDGYSVTNIRKDDVIVNDGNTSWRLEFSLK